MVNVKEKSNTLFSKLGATSIEKIPKISAFGWNFLHPLHNDNIGILYLIVIIKFVFFKISPPLPQFQQKAEPKVLLKEQNFV